MTKLTTAESSKGSTLEGKKVHLIARGAAGVIALHAAALAPDLYASVHLHNSPTNWSDVVSSPLPLGQLETAVHGALTVYDLPNLVDLIGSDKVRRINQK